MVESSWVDTCEIEIRQNLVCMNLTRINFDLEVMGELGTPGIALCTLCLSFQMVLLR